jgi:hypothetical protein
MRTSLFPLLAGVLIVFACGEAEEELDRREESPDTGRTLRVGCQLTPGISELGTPKPYTSPWPDSEDCEEVGTGAFVDFGGLEGQIAPVPPLPPEFVLVSDYFDFRTPGEEPAVAGFALPLREEVTDPASIAFYSYVDGEWERVAEVSIVRDGRAEGEFTTLPPNLAVLRDVR